MARKNFLKRRRINPIITEYDLENYVVNNIIKVNEQKKKSNNSFQENSIDNNNTTTFKIIALKAPVNITLVYSGSTTDSRWEKIREIIKQNADINPEIRDEDLEPEIPYYRVNKFKTIKELRLEVTQASSSDHENLEESSDSLSSELVLNSSEPVVTNLFTINTEEIGRRYQKIKLEREPHDINSYVALHSYYIESLNIQFLPAPNNYILTGACSLIDPRFLHISNMLS